MPTSLMRVIINDELRVVTNDILREIRSHGTEDFPFEFCKEYFDWKYSVDAVVMHWHNEMQIILIEQGCMQCKVSDQTFVLHAGEGLFINSGVLHCFEAPEGQENSTCIYSNVIFAPELLAPVGSAIYKRYIKLVMDCGTDCILLKQDVAWQRHMIRQINQIAETCSSGCNLAELRIHTDLCQLWIILAEHIEEYRQQPKTSRNMVMQARLRKMLHFISEHYAERITIDDIAQAANVSKSEALRCFRAGMQTAPNTYLNQYRLNRAKEKLLTDQDSISNIALSVGFETVGYFDRIFKRTFGMTPKQFIRQETAGAPEPPA